MQRINNFLRNEAAILTVLVLSLAAQMPHAAYVFRNIANDSAITGWTFAIAMESAVLIFVMRGREKVSYGFAAVSIAMNLCYYAMHDVSIFAVDAFPAWLVSFVLPVAIALYSHDVARDASPQNAQEGPVMFEWIDTRYPPLSQPQRRTELVSVANVPVHEPEQAANVQVVEDTPQAAQMPVQESKRETAIERNARLAAETEQQATALHGLATDERRSALLQMLQNGHANSTQPELADIFGVSVSTISRDIAHLQPQLQQ